jgi:hypothetical protein
LNGQLLARERRHALLVAVTGMLARDLTLVPRSTEPGHFVLQDGRGDEQTQRDGQTVQRILHHSEQFIPIQRELDLVD